MSARIFRQWLWFLSFLIAQVFSFSYAAEKVTFYVSDRLTESAILLDESGNIVGRERLASYGAIELSSPTEDRFSVSYHGKERDGESGLINFGARMYDPDVGRFLSTDPRGFNESNLLSFNRYAFANNNPYRYTDPDGRVVETPVDFISLGVGLYSLSGNLSSGNWGAAALDFLSVGLDGVAAALPGIPGGASLIVKGQREASEVASSLPNSVVKGEATQNFDIAPRVLDQLKDARLGSLAGKLGPDDLQKLANNPSAKRFLDARTGNINVIQEVEGRLLRITTPRDAQKIISVGPIRPNQVTNRVDGGDFIPLK